MQTVQASIAMRLACRTSPCAALRIHVLNKTPATPPRLVAIADFVAKNQNKSIRHLVQLFPASELSRDQKDNPR